MLSKASLYKFYVRGAAVIDGGLVARDTSFEKPISVAAERVELDSAKLVSLTMRRADKSQKVQQVVLQRNTIVRGDIFFEERGEVFLEEGVKTQGTVKNGKL